MDYGVPSENVAQTGKATVQFELDYITALTRHGQRQAGMYGALHANWCASARITTGGSTGEGMADVVRTRTGYKRNHWTRGGSRLPWPRVLS